MKPGFLRLFFAFFVLVARPPAVAGQSIAVDHFDGLRFDAPVPARVQSGQEIPLSASLLDTTWQEALFSFRPLDGAGESDGADLDFPVLHLPGRIERSLVFAATQADSYEVFLFAGTSDKLEFRGVFGPFIVQPANGSLSLPTLFFDGVRLDAPLPTQLTVDSAAPLAGQIVDRRISSARLDLSRDGIQLGTLRVPLDKGRFDLPLRLGPGTPGPVLVQLVVGLDDGTFWARGEFLFEITDDPVAQATPAVLSVALLPGGVGDVRVANRGDADLRILAASATAPFEVVTLPGPILPGETGAIVVRYAGTGGDEGELVFDTNDPLRRQRRVALLGMTDGQTAAALAWIQADADGQVTALAPAGVGHFALALFSPQHDLDAGVQFDFTVGQGGLQQSPPVARPAALRLTRRQLGEATRARKAAHLAAEVRRLGPPSMALRRAQTAKQTANQTASQTTYSVGEKHDFVFAEFPPVPRQVLATRVVAVSDHAVALVHVGTEADGGGLTADDIQAHLARFDADHDRIVATFGMPSDVDGDGRIALLYTPLVDDIGLGGFQDPTSVLAEAFGGSGNLTDLLFLSPTQPAASYRSLLVHEFQHLINFHQHVLVRAGESEATWLDEGLSHLAEDLVDGFVSGGNNDNVRDFLLDPGSVGLTAQDRVSSAERGAAYLFVRSLVDRFGEAILLRLVQTGLADRNTVEQAAGVPFRELLAGYAVQIFASGTGLAGHSRFNFTFAGLGGPSSRGFPQPEILHVGAGGSVAGSIRPRGVAFLQVSTRGIVVQAPVEAQLNAVLVPLPDGFVAAIDIPAGHFSGVRFDPPVPGAILSGEPVLLRGSVLDASSSYLTAQYSADGAIVASYGISVNDEGRFERTLIFSHDQAGDLVLDLFVGSAHDNEFAGTFAPIRVGRGSGDVLLPRGFFDTVVLDAPLPTRMDAGTQITVSGTATRANVDGVIIELVSVDGDRASFRAGVDHGRFSVDLSVTAELAGSRQLRLFTGVQGDFLYRGGFDVAIGGPTTAVTEAQGVVPADFSLPPTYPNPFNATAVIPLEVARDGPADVAIYGLGGQRVVTLFAGRLSAGVHHLRWHGLDRNGRPVASGVYLLRAVVDQQQASRKMLLLR